MTFRAHEYFDRENGLMVIGTEADLHELASQLGQSPEYNHNNWPRCVARVNIGTDTDPYNLSFHIETNTAIPKANVPRSSKAF